MTKYEILPQNSYNTDEKGFFIGILQKIHHVFGRDQKKSGKLLGGKQYGSREWVSLLACICQDFTALPHFSIYSSQAGNVMDSLFEDFMPDEHEGFFASSETGWTNGKIGKLWLEKVFDQCNCTKQKARNGRDFRCLI